MKEIIVVTMKMTAMMTKSNCISNKNNKGGFIMFAFLLTAAAYGIATSERNNSGNYEDDSDEDEE